ncbi:MAG: 7-cyano-7-deazaguanine synthase [Candidatus Omnitrophica bacterium]|nr:7-cyano-7-deazaguanine synthase [Candidatus Omnitrophota bacterium]
MSPRKPAVCALISGGVDSAILVDRLQASGCRVLPLYVRAGLRWESAEIFWVRRLLSAMTTSRMLPLHIIAMPMASVYGRHWSLTGPGVPGARSRDAAVYLPGRNLLLSAAAAIACAPHQITTIALGILKGNPFGDATPQFFRRLSACLTQALGAPIRITTPLARMAKPEWLRRHTTAPLALTFSCLAPAGHGHCGRCNKCAERQRAFRAAGITDPTAYATR